MWEEDNLSVYSYSPLVTKRSDTKVCVFHFLFINRSLYNFMNPDFLNSDVTKFILIPCSLLCQ